MFHGSMVALVTPMQTDGSIDIAALDRLIEWHIAQGTHAIVAVGTTGESSTLDFDEHCAILRHFVAKVAGRIPVIAGTGANATAEAIALTECALQAGVDACLLVTPYYNKPTQEGLYRHYKAIAEAVPIPQILYNVPGRTACDMLPTTVERLAGISNIVGIKEASGNMERIKELVARCGKQLDIISGEDAINVDVVAAGGKGTISVTANVAPHAMAMAMDAALRGDIAAAREINRPLEELHKVLFLEANPIPVKWALTEMGMIGPTLRLPLTELSQPHHERVRNGLKLAGCL
ncbi:MAG: 4-hydroxy-tetrahydrodipicolinate synthase [Gammaproteobacteria bacterium]|nr:4-hydroxy-tetrahydrodipicolinate synthase [Gammaproteobacteria bacterium]